MTVAVLQCYLKLALLLALLLPVSPLSEIPQRPEHRQLEGLGQGVPPNYLVLVPEWPSVLVVVAPVPSVLHAERPQPPLDGPKVVRAPLEEWATGTYFPQASYE
jgi:hypothetical protein